MKKNKLLSRHLTGVTKLFSHTQGIPISGCYKFDYNGSNFSVDVLNRVVAPLVDIGSAICFFLKTGV